MERCVGCLVLWWLGVLTFFAKRRFEVVCKTLLIRSCIVQLYGCHGWWCTIYSIIFIVNGEKSLNLPLKSNKYILSDIVYGVMKVVVDITFVWYCAWEYLNIEKEVMVKWLVIYNGWRKNFSKYTNIYICEVGRAANACIRRPDGESITWMRSRTCLPTQLLTYSSDCQIV